MKILVPIKRVPDYAIKLKVGQDGRSVEPLGAGGSMKWIVNPFDEIAVEEAIRIKEAREKAGAPCEVVVATLGPADAAQQLRAALAMGADRALHVLFDGEADSDLASRICVALYHRESPQLIILGKQAIDSDSGQTGQLIAHRLGISQACFASKVVLEEGRATVTREVDGGLETVNVPLPCVVTTDLRLNEPRYASLPGIMKAKKKPLDELTPESLGVATTVAVRIRALSLPPARAGGRKVESVEELVRLLRTEAKVLE